jgi:hypothetical protein
MTFQSTFISTTVQFFVLALSIFPMGDLLIGITGACHSALQGFNGKATPITER